VFLLAEAGLLHAECGRMNTQTSIQQGMTKLKDGV